MSTKWECLTDEFSAAVISSFDFLITEYDYILLEQEDENSEIGPRSIYSISYGSHNYDIVVVVSIDFEIFDIDVSLYESPKGAIEQSSACGRKRWEQGILLGSLIEYRTGDENIAYPIPPYVSSLSGRENNRRKKIRADKIDNGITGIVHEQAELLKEFGDNILKGDKSEFSAVQEFDHQKHGLVPFGDNKWLIPKGHGRKRKKL